MGNALSNCCPSDTLSSTNMSPSDQDNDNDLNVEHVERRASIYPTPPSLIFQQQQENGIGKGGSGGMGGPIRNTLGMGGISNSGIVSGMGDLKYRDKRLSTSTSVSSSFLSAHSSGPYPSGGNAPNSTSISTSSPNSPARKSSTKKNLKIDKMLSIDAQKKNNEIKILLLGPGESGKSTVLKQMKILHQNGFNLQELLNFREQIWRNIIEAAKQVIEAGEKLGLPLLQRPSEESIEYLRDFHLESFIREKVEIDEERRKSTNTINTIFSPSPPLSSNHSINQENGIEDKDHGQKSISSPPSTLFSDSNLLIQFAPSEILIQSLNYLWLESGVRVIFDKITYSTYVLDSAEYFFNNLDRIGLIDYIPTSEDVLKARIKTTGITETTFKTGQFHIRMIDIGGQRPERKKWIYSFEDITTVIFCISLSEYDQVLQENSNQNRLLESFQLFHSIVTSRWFAHTSIILFLNKMDIFQEKIGKVPLGQYFPEYLGNNTFEDASKFILDKLKELNTQNLHIYHFYTTATDTRHMDIVFSTVKETVLVKSLKESGII